MTLPLGIFFRIAKRLKYIPFPEELHQIHVTLSHSDLTMIYDHLQKYKDSQQTAGYLTPYLSDKTADLR